MVESLQGLMARMAWKGRSERTRPNSSQRWMGQGELVKLPTGAGGVEVKVARGLRRSRGCASTALGAEEETEAQGNLAQVTQLVKARAAAGTLSLNPVPFRARGPTQPAEDPAPALSSAPPLPGPRHLELPG